MGVWGFSGGKNPPLRRLCVRTVEDACPCGVCGLAGRRGRRPLRCVENCGMSKAPSHTEIGLMGGGFSGGEPPPLRRLCVRTVGDACPCGVSGLAGRRGRRPLRCVWIGGSSRTSTPTVCGGLAGRRGRRPLRCVGDWRVVGTPSHTEMGLAGRRGRLPIRRLNEQDVEEKSK